MGGYLKTWTNETKISIKSRAVRENMCVSVIWVNQPFQHLQPASDCPRAFFDLSKALKGPHVHTHRNWSMRRNRIDETLKWKQWMLIDFDTRGADGSHSMWQILEDAPHMFRGIISKGQHNSLAAIVTVVARWCFPIIDDWTRYKLPCFFPNKLRICLNSHNRLQTEVHPSSEHMPPHPHVLRSADKWRLPPRGTSIFGGSSRTRALTPVSLGAICNHREKPSCHTGHLRHAPTGIALVQLLAMSNVAGWLWLCGSGDREGSCFNRRVGGSIPGCLLVRGRGHLAC